MELKQLQYFVKVVLHGSMGRAALELDVVTSTLSQQISRLESELSTRLLQRTSVGVIPTDAGMEFWRHAQLILRQVEQASLMTKDHRLAGQVSLGMSATTGAVLAIPFVRKMMDRYPGVQIHLTEALSGQLAALLNSRQIDLAIIFDPRTTTRCTAIPLLEEELFIVAAKGLEGAPEGTSTTIKAIKDLPLILPSGSHTLRALVLSAYERSRAQANISLQVDGMAIVIDAVRAGIGATILPGSAMGRLSHEDFAVVRIEEKQLRRISSLVSLPDEELSPASLAARVVLTETARELVQNGSWLGATLSTQPILNQTISGGRTARRALSADL